VNDAVWFAGEALHETLWGTVGGAWESGERAADAVLHRLGGGKEAPVAEVPPPARPKSRAPRTRQQEIGAGPGLFGR
jgi:Flavin containing amine oxidoreductase